MNDDYGMKTIVCEYQILLNINIGVESGLFSRAQSSARYFYIFW